MYHPTDYPTGPELRQSLIREVGRYVFGQEHLIERLLVALLCEGHVLIEGVPGLAKTRVLSVLSALLSCSMKRIQFTPDLLPADITGTEVYQASLGEFSLRKGPVFTNVVLADEINRAPAKVQSALLQSMQERVVTIGDQTLALPRPFFVLATQNPIEQEGTYPLPEAQLDRFLFKILIDYPAYADEVQMLSAVGSQMSDPALPDPVISIEALVNASQQSLEVFVDPKIDEYIVRLVQATREPKSFGLGDIIEWGASPRASLALKRAGRALALVRGRDFVGPDIIQELAPDVLRHRIVLSFEAEARNITASEVVHNIVQGVPEP
ncbi:MAG: AAA family ATPase [Bdellovibrionota bacterium]